MPWEDNAHLDSYGLEVHLLLIFVLLREQNIVYFAWLVYYGAYDRPADERLPQHINSHFMYQHSFDHAPASLRRTVMFPVSVYLAQLPCASDALVDIEPLYMTDDTFSFQTSAALFSAPPRQRWSEEVTHAQVETHIRAGSVSMTTNCAEGHQACSDRVRTLSCTSQR